MSRSSPRRVMLIPRVLYRHVGRCLSNVSSGQEPLFLAALNEDEHDVVIVGGGMVGAAVACGLASSPYTSSLRTAIIDGSVLHGTDETKSVPDPRVSAITPSTVAFFKEIGAWEAVQASRHAPFDSMQVWDYSGQGFTRYRAADVGRPFLGYVVENSLLLAALRSRLQSVGFGEMICPAQVKSVVFPSRHARHPALASGERVKSGDTASTSSVDGRNENWARVLLEDGRCLQTRLVVGADGGRSKVREKAGFQTTGWDYKQHAVICTVRVDQEHRTAWQRFLPTGPIALLPMGEDFSNIVWSTTPESAEELKSMSNEEFVSAVNHAFSDSFVQYPTSNLTEFLANYLGSLFLTAGTPSSRERFESPPVVTALASVRMSFPLSLRHSNRYVGQRVALVGDAAHTVHPLAGQGVNLGFGDAASLVKIIQKGVKYGSDVGEVTLLEEYEGDRMAFNLPMMAVLDGFQRVFSANNGLVNLARAVGFSAVQLLGPLKKSVIKFAMGFRDEAEK